MDSSVFYFTIALLILFWIYKKLFDSKESLKSLGIAHLKPLPILGNTLPIILQRKNFIEFGDDLYNKFSHKKLFGFYSFFNDYTLILSDPALIKQIMIKDFEYFPNRDRVDDKIDKYLGRSILMLRDQQWKDMRANLTPVYTSSKIKQMFGLLQECTDDFISFHEEKARKAQGQVVIDTHDAFARTTADGIASTALGLAGDCVRNEQSEIFQIAESVESDFSNPRTAIFLNLFPKLSYYLGLQMFRKSVHKFFETTVLGEIRRRRENNIQRLDVVQLLIQAQDGILKSEPGYDVNDNYTEAKIRKSYKWSDVDLVAQALVFFLGGFETTATLMQACAWELAQNQKVQQTLIDEVDEIMENLDGKAINYDQLNQMKYLEMVINETLRKWPSFRLTSRLCAKDYTMKTDDGNSYTIRKGVELFIPFGSIQNDPKYFKDPENFDPERFNEENKKNILPGTFLPFGMGPRICIGSRYALIEAKLLLFSIIAKFRFEKCEKTPEKLVLGSGTTGFAGSIHVSMKLRK